MPQIIGVITIGLCENSRRVCKQVPGEQWQFLKIVTMRVITAEREKLVHVKILSSLMCELIKLQICAEKERGTEQDLALNML